MDQDPAYYQLCILNIIDIIAAHLKELDAGTSRNPTQPSFQFPPL